MAGWLLVVAVLVAGYVGVGSADSQRVEVDRGSIVATVPAEPLTVAEWEPIFRDLSERFVVATSGEPEDVQALIDEARAVTPPREKAGIHDELIVGMESYLATM